MGTGQNTISSRNRWDIHWFLTGDLCIEISLHKSDLHIDDLYINVKFT